MDTCYFVDMGPPCTSRVSGDGQRPDEKSNNPRDSSRTFVFAAFVSRRCVADVFGLSEGDRGAIEEARQTLHS